MLNGTETRSPFLMNSTSGPSSITSPVISWPRIRLAGAVVRPRTMCWSEPQMFVETILRIAPWLHCRPTFAGLTPGPSFNSKVGKLMSCTSTFPGSMYATPLLSAICVLLTRSSVPFALDVSARALEATGPRACVRGADRRALARCHTPAFDGSGRALLVRRDSWSLHPSGAGHEVVDQRRDRAAGQRPDDVDPEVLPGGRIAEDRGGEIGAERARRVERAPGERPDHHDGAGHGEPDDESRESRRCPPIHRERHDRRHQQESSDGLGADGLAVADVRAQHGATGVVEGGGALAEDRDDQESAAQGADELRGDVGHRLDPGEAPNDG